MSNTDVEGDLGAPRSGAESDGSVKEMLAGGLQTVKEEAASFAAGAREKAGEKLEEQRQTASHTLGDFANAVRKAGDELATSDQSFATQVVRQAADGLAGLAHSVSEKKPEELLEAMRDFGRRNPTALIAGSVLAGIALGRFFKSSSDDGVTSAGDQPNSPPPYKLAEDARAHPAPAGAEAASIGVPEAELGETSMEPRAIGDASAGDSYRDVIGGSGATETSRPGSGA